MWTFAWKAFDVLINVILSPPPRVFYLRSIHFLGLPMLATCPNRSRLLCLFRIGKRNFLDKLDAPLTPYGRQTTAMAEFFSRFRSSEMKTSLAMGFSGKFRVKGENFIECGKLRECSGFGTQSVISLPRQFGNQLHQQNRGKNNRATNVASSLNGFLKKDRSKEGSK